MSSEKQAHDNEHIFKDTWSLNETKVKGDSASIAELPRIDSIATAWLSMQVILNTVLTG